MESNLRIRMRVIHSLSPEEPKYGRVVAELWDGDRFSDAIEFERKGAKVITAPGYTQDLEGARQQAYDYWM